MSAFTFPVSPICSRPHLMNTLGYDQKPRHALSFRAGKDSGNREAVLVRPILMFDVLFNYTDWRSTDTSSKIARTPKRIFHISWFYKLRVMQL